MSGLIFSQTRVDRSRPIKERVLGVRLGYDGGKGFPFGELNSLGETGTFRDIAGRAIQGELEREILTPFDVTYVLFRFARRFFQPDAEIFVAWQSRIRQECCSSPDPTSGGTGKVLIG